MKKMSQEKKKRSLCLVDLCKNEGIHLFPKDESRKAQWVQAIVHFKPGRTIKKYSHICSAHFKPNDFIRTPLSVLQPNLASKILKNTAIPSIFPWKNASQPPIISKDQDSSTCTAPEPDDHQESLTLDFSQIQNTYSRTPPISFVEEQIYFNTMPYESSEDPLKCDIKEDESDSDRQQPYSEDVSNTDIEMEELNIAEYIEIAQSEEINICQESLFENRECHEKYVQTENVSFITKTHESSTQTEGKSTLSIHYIKNNDKAIHFYTGLENFKKLLFVFQTLGQCVNKLKYFYGNPAKKVDALDFFL